MKKYNTQLFEANFELKLTFQKTIYILSYIIAKTLQSN